MRRQLITLLLASSMLLSGCVNIHPNDVESEPEEMTSQEIVEQHDRWEIDYRIPAAFIQKYIPSYRHGTGATLRGNFYKCGDLTDHKHYGCFHNIDWDHPDFHRPEFFATFELI